MSDLPDDLERLEGIAANLCHRLAGIEARIRRLKDEQQREHQVRAHQVNAPQIPMKDSPPSEA